MPLDQRSSSIIVLGSNCQAGSYVLRIHVRGSMDLTFGRFRGGKSIRVPMGEYAYIGSALGTRGAVSPGRRLVRHATRTGNMPPHPIRAHMIDYFKEIKLGQGDLRPKKGKTLFWNVDHLLDQPCVELTGVFLIRSGRRLEELIHQLLEEDPHTAPLAKGIGANDAPGKTHILRVEADAAWWDSLPQRLETLLNRWSHP